MAPNVFVLCITQFCILVRLNMSNFMSNNQNTSNNRNGIHADRGNKIQALIEVGLNETNMNVEMIKIYDSYAEDISEMQPNNQHVNEMAMPEADLNREKDVKPTVKFEPSDINSGELADVPMVLFDPNKKTIAFLVSKKFMSGKAQSEQNHLQTSQPISRNASVASASNENTAINAFKTKATSRGI